MNEREYFRRVGEFLGGWPSSYLVYDLETQGPNPNSTSTLPIEFGWCLVQGGTISSMGSEMLDWGRDGTGVDSRWFYESIQATAKAMHDRGKRYRFTPDLVRAEGKAPVDVLRMAAGVLASARVDSFPVAGFNHARFDNPILLNAFKRINVGFLPMEWDELIDAMVITRGRDTESPPLAADNREQWFSRLLNRKVRGTLEDAVVRYQLKDAKAEDAHTGKGDAVATHLLIEEFKRLSA